MEVRITISLLLAFAAITEYVTFASGNPISKIPIDPEVEPASEYELMVSKAVVFSYICISFSFSMQIELKFLFPRLWNYEALNLTADIVLS